MPAPLERTGIAVATSLNLVSGFGRTFTAVRDAQRMRGWRPRGIRSWNEVLVPVVLTAIEDSVLLAEAMEARGSVPDGGPAMPDRPSTAGTGSSSPERSGPLGCSSPPGSPARRSTGNPTRLSPCRRSTRCSSRAAWHWPCRRSLGPHALDRKPREAGCDGPDRPARRRLVPLSGSDGAVSARGRPGDRAGLDARCRQLGRRQVDAAPCLQRPGPALSRRSDLGTCRGRGPGSAADPDPTHGHPGRPGLPGRRDAVGLWVGGARGRLRAGEPRRSAGGDAPPPGRGAVRARHREPARAAALDPLRRGAAAGPAGRGPGPAAATRGPGRAHVSARSGGSGRSSCRVLESGRWRAGRRRGRAQARDAAPQGRSAAAGRMRARHDGRSE